MKYGYIYKIVNLVNNKMYVGQTTQSIKRRFKKHISSSNGEDNTYIHNAIKKYGANKFVIYEIDSAKNQNELNNKEIYWIKKLNTKIPNGYNLTDGGDGIKGYHHTKETINLLRIKSLGNKSALGKHEISKEGKENMIKAHKNKTSCFYGKHHTNIAKSLMSNKHNKPVICIETNKIYPSSLIASKELNITNHIGRCCNGERKTCGGYHWRWE